MLLQVSVRTLPLLDAAATAASVLPQLLQLSLSGGLLLLQVSIGRLPLLNGAATAGCCLSQLLQLSFSMSGSGLCFRCLQPISAFTNTARKAFLKIEP